MGWSKYLPLLGLGSAVPRVDPVGKLWTGWSEWYGCAGNNFWKNPSEVCAFPERRKLKSYRYKLCVYPDESRYPTDNPTKNVFGTEDNPQKMFKEELNVLS